MKEEERKRLESEQLTRDAEARAEKAIRDFYDLDATFRAYRASWPVKVAHQLSRIAGFGQTREP